MDDMDDDDWLSAEPDTDDRNPSGVADVYWLHADRRRGDYPEHTDRGGKWLLFVPAGEVDEAWDAVREATEAGRLGGSAKVATARPSPLARDPGVRVICVYTYDWTDAADVRRVRAGLRDLGFTAPIPYKADEDTLAGNYADRGTGPVSKYYE